MEIDQLKDENESDIELSADSPTMKKETSFDHIFSIVPHYSIHQFLITMFGFYIGIIAGEVQVASVFFQASPKWNTNFNESEYRCETELDKRFNISFRDGFIPISDDNCDLYYPVDYSPLPTDSSVDEIQDYFTRNKPENTTQCVDFMQVPDFPMNTSAVTEFIWICDRSWLDSLSTSIAMVGILLGALTSGFLGDTIGRLRVILLYAIGCCISCLAISFAKDQMAYILLRPISILFAHGGFSIAFTYVMEMVGPSFRNGY